MIEVVGGEVSFLSNSTSEMDAASLSWVKEIFFFFFFWVNTAEK